METKFTSGDVCEIAGIPMNTLDRWVNAGFVGPADVNQGHGRYRTYSLDDVLAITAGARYRSEGATPDRVAGIIRFLAELGIGKLKEEIKQGRSFPVPAMMLGETVLSGGMMVSTRELSMSKEAKALLDRLDLTKILADVERKVARLAHKPAPPGRGRKRGLVGAFAAKG